MTTEFLPSWTAGQLCNALTKVIYIYLCGGYMVCTALMDMEFEPLVSIMDEVTINTTTAHEHVRDVECAIRVIKESGPMTTCQIKS